MRRYTLLPMLLLLAQLLQAQLTLHLTSIPLNTPPGPEIHVAGTFNNWDPADPNMVLASQGNGQYSITINPPAGLLKFKFTRGSWATVEGNANGTYLPDREYTYNGQPTTLDLSVLSWEDQGSGGSGTAAPNVQVMDNAFYMPQLNRTRRIWIYLPPDYATSTKNYPVLYMHDGQNLFDENTAAFGTEWEVDESLNALAATGNYGCIVIGIDNDGAHRLDEYSPWLNPQYNEGGEGAQYVDFLINTLKPYVDAHYRTLPGRQSTGIMGSSMGGLISMYALAERQDVYSKAGIFSPAFWFGGSNPVTHVTGHPKQDNVRVYFMSGTDEEADGNQSNYVVEDMQDVADAMQEANFTAPEIHFETHADGQHSEWFWAREFPDAYLWLFQDAVTSTRDKAAAKALQVFPNPAGEVLRIADLAAGKKAAVQIIGADGRLCRDTVIKGGDPIQVADLPAGFYLVKMRAANGIWRVGRFIKN